MKQRTTAVMASAAITILMTIACWYGYAKLTYTFTEKPAPDLQIFLEHGQQFIQHGTLYTRHNPDETLAFLYRPLSSEFKFPPAAEIIFYPFFKEGTDYLYIGTAYGFKFPNISSLLPFRIAVLTILLLSLRLIIFWIMSRTGNQYTTTQKIVGIGTFVFIAATSETFYIHLYYVNIDALLLLLLVLACILSSRHAFSSGILAGLCTGMKIYPGLLLGYSLLQPRKTLFAGMLAGIALSVSAGWVLFHHPETLFYFKNILPVLLQEDILTTDYNLSPSKIFLWIGASQEAARLAFTSLQVIIIGGLCCCTLHYRKHPWHQVATLSLMLLAMPVMLRNSWTTYHIFLWPALLIACITTAGAPSVWRITGLLFCTLVLFTDQTWWGETQLLLENPQEHSDSVREFWASQGAAERQIKMLAYAPLKHSAHAIHILINSKMAIPFILAFYVVQSMNAPKKHPVNE